MSPYPQLYALLARHRRPSEALWETLCSLIRPYHFEKRELWVDIGDIPRNVCLIQSGAALAFQYHKDERRLVHIWGEGDLMLHAENGLAGRKSAVQVVFAVDSTVLTLSNQDLTQLRTTSEEMHRYVDALIADELQHLLDHIQWLKHCSAAQRIQDFRTQHPLLDALLPDDQKASYLGMSRRWYNSNK